MRSGLTMEAELKTRRDNKVFARFQDENMVVASD